MKRAIIETKNEVGRVLADIVDLFMEITKEQDPEYYAWMLRRNEALRNERLAREERKRIESEKPHSK